MKNNVKSIISLESLKKIVLILLIIYALYIILIQYNNSLNEDGLESFKDSLSVFGNNLDFEYSAGAIYKRIKKITDDKIKKSTIEEVTSTEQVDNEFSINHNNTPLGVIRYFPFQLPSKYSSWILCNGTKKAGVDYPELFRLINNRDPFDDNEEFSVPNLIGRMIFGRRFNRPNQRSPDISPLGGSEGKFMNPSNSNFFTKLKDDTEIQNLDIISRKKIAELGIESGSI